MPFGLRIVPSSVDGVVEAPPSKSYTHRAVFAALLAQAKSIIVNPLLSLDTSLSVSVARSLGADTEWGHRRLVIDSSSGLRWWPFLYCGESGTTLRISVAVASLLDKPILLYGEEGLHRRPLAGLLNALRGAGVSVIASPGGHAPVAVRGPLRSKQVVVDASSSSQYLTALLLMGSSVDGGLEVVVKGLQSRPYVEVTIRVLQSFDVTVERDEYRWFRVEGPPRPTTYRVPGDWSSAAPLLAAGVLAGRVRVTGISVDDPQPDHVIVDVVRDGGGRVRVGDGWVETEESQLEGFNVCVEDSPDLAPVLAALAARARGVSRICCIERLKLKESDRVEAITSILRAVGVDASIKDGCIVIDPNASKPRSARVSVYGDHRIAMMAALLALGLGVVVEVDEPHVVSKSFPGFWDALRRLGARLEDTRE